jgi:Domain of unknown function (DUF4326)
VNAEAIEANHCVADKTAENAGMPERIQLKRTKGWRMPPDTVKVDRTTRWGNPFVQGEVGEAAKLGHPVASELRGVLVRDRAHAVELFQRWILSESDVALAWRNSAPSLRGKNLACWCPLDGPCHANVLLQLANAPARQWPRRLPSGRAGRAKGAKS